MKKLVRLVVCATALVLVGHGCRGDVSAGSPYEYLAKVMDRFHQTFDVYTDSDAAGNHFPAKGRMNSPGDEDSVPVMNEACTNNPHSGVTCIEASFKAGGSNWGGWYFMVGVLSGDEIAPRLNWGDSPNAGIDLRGATKLTFWARGAKGGERVEFFCLGVGRDADTGHAIKPYPDSSRKVSTGFVTLSSEWKKYTIELNGKNLGYVLGGFGWATSSGQNDDRDITFYMDDIQYDKPRLDEPRFLVSYETIHSSLDFDLVMRNVAFTYDNAVALLAFVASGDKGRAKTLADALVYAQQHDRYYDDGRIRNAYQGGDLILQPGWEPKGRTRTVRMPGWVDPKEAKWLEDKIQVSSHTGNVAWAMLALLAYYEKYGGAEYLAAVEKMGNWVEHQCRDTRGAGGYTGGFEGWEPQPTKLLYKATEHNIDLYVAFQRLYHITGNEVWRDRADHAKRFVLAMWDQVDGKFWTGTKGDGATINKDVIPVDVQAWAILALRDEGKPYWKALDYADAHHKVGSGYDFNEDRDGIWHEGTAQMAAAYLCTGREEEWKTLISTLEAARFVSGGLPAASKDGLTTGFYLWDKVPWLYFQRAHVGATAWLILAKQGLNPFWVESKAEGNASQAEK